MARRPALTTNSTQTRSTGIAGYGAYVGAGGTTNGAPSSGHSNIFGALLSIVRPPKASPFREAGRMGTAVWGGYVEQIEKDHRLVGQNRYRTASDILANVSVVAAGLRFFLNLCAVPAWSVRPVEDLGPGKSSDEAKELAEFTQSVLDGMDTSLSRIVRRSGMFKFHGFAVQEWTARKRRDGKIGIADIEQRPQHTIERWELADDGTIIGMWQRWPQNGQLLYLPREKVVYLVDDTMTDSPEGLGLFRHLVDPSERIRRYLEMEGIGYERDMRGLPIGRAPIAEMNTLLANGEITQAEFDTALASMRQFLTMEAKDSTSSLLLDSSTFISPTADGYNTTNVDKWDLKLLTQGATGFADLHKAIDRLTHDMARVLGVETLLLGTGQGQGGGSRALSEDKSRNLYLSIDATVKDIAEGVRRDMLSAVWALNGLNPDLMPQLHTEDVAFKDAAQVAKALGDMATAGAILSPNDPAINDMRDMLGISRQPDDAYQVALESLGLPRVTRPKTGAIDPGGMAPDNPPGGGPSGGGASSGRAPRVGGTGSTPAPQTGTGGPSGPKKPGPAPHAPGSPEKTTPAGNQGSGTGRRNRTSSSSIV